MTKYRELGIDGCYQMYLDRIKDSRGFFARTFCSSELAEIGINFNVIQCSISHNLKRGTIRGMHYQIAPFEETKMVTCLQGTILDVIIDLRESSPTFMEHISVELTALEDGGIVIPKGCAHGFQTMEDDSLVHYQMDQVFCPSASRGIRWNDFRFGIRWPISDPILSAKDRSFGDYTK